MVEGDIFDLGGSGSVEFRTGGGVFYEARLVIFKWEGGFPVTFETDVCETEYVQCRCPSLWISRFWSFWNAIV